MDEEYKTLQIEKGVNVLVSKNGSIINPVTKRELKHRKDRYGYCHVHLHTKTYDKSLTVHRLVAKAFIPNPDNKSQVNHINGEKDDNRADNLEWCTPSENIKHAFRTGLKQPCGGETPRPIKCVETGVIFPSTRAVARCFGAKSNASLYWALKCKNHRAWGYHWEYYREEEKCDNRDAAKILQEQLNNIDKEVIMSEFRVMKGDDAFLIQQNDGDGWETIGEMDDIEKARHMVRDLRGQR